MRKTILVILMTISILFLPQGLIKAQVMDPDGIGYEPGPPKDEDQSPSELVKKKVKRAEIELKDVYYYDKERNKVYPEISTKKAAVLFDVGIREEHIKQLLKESKFVVDAYTIKDDSLPYKTLLIFELEDGLLPTHVLRVLNCYNELSATKAVSPVFLIDSKEFVFFGVFEMKLKGNLSERMEKALQYAEFSMQDADPKDMKLKRCRIILDKNKLNYFQIINQFAEDFEVVYATPLMKEIGDLVTVKQEVELDGAKLGSRIPYKLTVIKDPKVTIDPSSLTTIVLMPPSELFSQHLNEYNLTDIIKGTKLVATGYIQFFSPGDYNIPNLKVAYINSEGKTRVAMSNELNIRIASLVPEKTSTGIIATPPLGEYKPKINIDNLSQVQNSRIIILAALAVAALGLILLPIVTWLRKSSAPVAVDPLPGAVNNLMAALNSSETGKEYFASVDKGVREALNASTGSDFSSGACESVRTRLTSMKLEDLAEKAFQALNLCENALSQPSDYQVTKDTLIKAVEELIATVKK